MTSSGFQADTAAIAQTSQKAAESADAIIGYFKKMNQDTGQVLPMCKGTMFNEVGVALANLQNDRNKMLQQLQTLSDSLKKGGQGMDGQSDAGASGVRGAASSALSISPNTRV